MAPTLPTLASGPFDQSERLFSELETNHNSIMEVLRQVPGLEYDGTGGSITELTIATGSITPTHGYHLVDTEADAAADTLSLIAPDNFEVGRMLMIQQDTIGRKVTVEHANGAEGEIILNDGNDWNMRDKAALLVVQLRGTAPNRFWNEVMRVYGNTQDAIDERMAAQGIIKRLWYEADDSFTWPQGYTTAHMRGVGGGGGGGGASDGTTGGGNGGDGGDTLVDENGGGNLATFEGGKGGGGGQTSATYNGAGGSPAGGSAGGVSGRDAISTSLTSPGGEARPTSLGDFGKGGRGGNGGGAGGGGGGASGSVTLDQFQIITGTPGTLYDVTIGAAGTAGAQGGSGPAGLVGIKGALLIEFIP